MEITPFRTIMLVFIVILTGTAGFGLGRYSVFEMVREPVTIKRSSIFTEMATLGFAIDGSIVGGDEKDSGFGGEGQVVGQNEVVGSKNGTKYHYPWCPGAQRINPENLVTFTSIAAARSGGYTPAANCDGLE